MLNAVKKRNSCTRTLLHQKLKNYGLDDNDIDLEFRHIFNGRTAMQLNIGIRRAADAQIDFVGL